MRHKGADHLEQRHHYEVDEAGLRSRYVGLFAVAQHAYWQVLVFFYVALNEEFFEEEVGPLVS